MFTEQHEQIIEQIAAQLADANDPETAWALRGFVDGTQGYSTDPQVARHGYAGEYQRGYETGAREWGENPYHHGDPYGNPLTDDQHYRAQKEAQRIAQFQIERGDPQAHALFTGAAAAHQFAHAGIQWPEIQPPTPNPCGAGGYGYPPQAVPAPNPVKDDGKWHKRPGGYQMIPHGSPTWAIIVPYSPRAQDWKKADLSRRVASIYEAALGQTVPSGTKWIVYFHDDTGIPPSAHRTLAAAKRAGSAAISTRSNPWTQAASGPLSSSFSPPPDPFHGHQIGSGPIASSYSPPVDPFGRPAFISGTLQGPTAIRAVPGYPLYPGG